MSHTFIIGNSGSGKSTLARQLSAEQGALHVDLDRFAWARVLGVRRELDDAACAVRETMAGRTAIIEGCYADLVETLATCADHLILLDVSVEQCVRHCEARPFEPHKWDTAEAQDAFLPQLIEYVRTYPTREDALGWRAHEALFRRFAGTKERRGTTAYDPCDVISS